jgi:hypothetical protein
MIDEVQEYWPESGGEPPSPEEQPLGISNSVFVVHGHNVAVRESVARLLERLELAPINLHEQPNKGRTDLTPVIVPVGESYFAFLSSVETCLSDPDSLSYMPTAFSSFFVITALSI